MRGAKGGGRLRLLEGADTFSAFPSVIIAIDGRFTFEGEISFLKLSRVRERTSVVTELRFRSLIAAINWPREGFPSLLNGTLFRSKEANLGMNKFLASSRVNVAQMSSMFLSLLSSFFLLVQDSPMAL